MHHVYSLLAAMLPALTDRSVRARHENEKDVKREEQGNLQVVQMGWERAGI